ncbi:hypothetical protein IGI46_003705 [Enterococcus sp. AZ163]|uniref:Uncharacterized protein n=1 Tax=Candidatus Enterococcus ferrettii TaxID=2815324 RepID=A0ABV0EVS5_9ENTE
MVRVLQEIRTIYFSGRVDIGSYLDESENGFVITHILSVKESTHEDYEMEIQAIVQHIGKTSDYDDYEPVFEFDDIHRNCDKETEYELEKLGHVDDLDSVCLLTTDILSVTYQEGDLIAEYEGKLFVPWNEDELKSAKKNYLSRRFNVVDGRK